MAEPVPDDVVREAIRIAASYTPIEPTDLYEGCLGPTQSHDVSLRVMAQFYMNGWAVMAPGGFR